MFEISNEHQFNEKFKSISPNKEQQNKTDSIGTIDRLGYQLSQLKLITAMDIKNISWFYGNEKVNNAINDYNS